VEIVDFSFGEDYILNVIFEDGTTAIKDMKPLLNRGVFQALQDKDFFKQARIENGTVTWPNGIDFCPHSLYEQTMKR